MEISKREVTSSAVIEEKQKLRKEFKYLDMIFYTLAALIGLDTIGAFASFGAQSFTWLVISAITFLVPYALLTAELGSTEPFGFEDGLSQPQLDWERKRPVRDEEQYAYTNLACDFIPSPSTKPFRYNFLPCFLCNRNSQGFSYS